ncbi:putative DNA base hypermodification protein [Actinotalea sp. M2MS4P-6]|uniref:nucleotide kinase domain-containing protein n=1 Tax=Actinotalea sp. M2MS4P-6 TaxID=2983762 RepID=UPI0021E471A5|nr:nucleotide kinase domain-containing protein [Actinotalea sp. M2MS4P-6]MCV2394500.1 putative DNA base hypermodification protein [Actinotalea sp. M2MS4P-6]
MRSIAINGHTVIATDVLQSYWFVAAERQRMYHQRLRAQPYPWTRDPILSAYRFTNAYRAADRVSQDLIRVQYAGSQEPDDLLLRTLIYRFFNKPSTWAVVEGAVGSLTTAAFDVERISLEMDRRLALGQRIYSPAYIIPPPPFGAARKHLNHLRLAKQMIASDAASAIEAASSLREVFNIISSYPSLGPFLAFQLTIDLNYSALIDFDENEFVVAGPGARSGIAKCFVDTDGLRPEDLIRWAVDHQQEEFERYGLDFEDLFGRPLALIDCQNLFCETDKYARVAHPDAPGIGQRTRIKQRFAPQTPPSMPQPFFPPKWGLNERAQAADQTVSGRAHSAG